MRPSRRRILAGLPAVALAACDRAPVQAQDIAIDPRPALRDVAGFPVGVCASTTELADPDFVALALGQFSQVTPTWEMKMERILAAGGGMQFEAADAIADFCRQHGLALHGTTLVWYSQDPPAFEQVAGDRAAFAKALRTYVLTVVDRYRGLARGWDALNEAVAEDGHGYRGGIWSRVLGEDYARMAFDLAHEADPDAVLFLNDYNLEILPAKLDSFQRLLERLLNAGAPVGGVGTQSHLEADLPPGEASRAIRALARFGLPIHVSELDISTRVKGLSFASPAQRLRSQARVAGELAEAFMDLPPAQRYAFTVWGARDKDSWLRYPPNAGDGSDQPLLFDDQGAPKPAFGAVRQAFLRGGG